MKILHFPLPSCARLFPVVILFSALIASAQPVILWEAYNDYHPTAGVTSDNASTYELRAADSGGPLRNIETGEDLGASVFVVIEGAVPDAFGANSQVNPGTPADKLFKDKVDIGNDGIPGVRASASTKLILSFSGLDPGRRYNFRGTVSRGGNYNDRWSVFSITGAEAYLPAHQDGSNNKNLITKTSFPNAELEPNQVALNSGDNKAGSLVGWDGIQPSAEGTFAIEAQQYVGPAPFGVPSAGPYGYGFTAIYMAEVEATGDLRITDNPLSQKVPAGKTATITVGATSTKPITYQWQKAVGEGSPFVDIPNATQASYVTPVLAVVDDGSKYRCVLTSGPDHATSGEATLTVDGTIPTATGITGSINLNAASITFSEPMELEVLAAIEHYQISGGLTIVSATALDPTTVRLVTSAQTSDQNYTVTLNNLEDLAGNKIAPNTALSFTAFSLQTGVVGLEIWNGILGSTAADLRNNPRYPAEPDIDYAVATFDSLLVIPDGPNNAYGGRFRAYLTPDESTEYEFFIRADDGGELRIGMEETFDNIDSPDILPDAVDATAGGPFQDPGVDTSTSIPIFLEAGRRYPIQAIWKEANGGDFCQVAWRKVGDETPAADLQPIPSAFLSYYGPSAGNSPKITKIALENNKVVIEWTGAVLQSSDDLKNWVDVPGATSPLTITPVKNTFYRSRN